MSYDLTARADDRYSRMTSRESLTAFITTLPSIQPNGSIGFALDDQPSRWMEIDLEVVSEDGDWIGDDEGVDDSQINCIRFHIPYGFLKPESFEQDYLSVALAIAKEVGWPLYDEQSEQSWSPE